MWQKSVGMFVSCGYNFKVKLTYETPLEKWALFNGRETEFSGRILLFCGNHKHQNCAKHR